MRETKPEAESLSVTIECQKKMPSKREEEMYGVRERMKGRENSSCLTAFLLK